jgi:signal transduction histidine kinase
MCAVRDIILPIAEEKGLAVALTPPAADWRIGHSAALHRVLLNLSTNALKFTDDGRVDVTARQLSRTTVEFSVADTGRGLPDAIIDSIRNPESPAAELGSKTFSSTGLGLSICRKLVAGMGGELEAETTQGSGSRIFFRIDLPLASRV